MAKDRTKDLTRGTPWKVIAGFSLPVIGGNLFQLFYTLADSMIVGRTLGADALAAVGATATIVYFVLCFIQGLTGGCGILLGQAFGAGNEKQVRESVSASVWISALFTIVLTVLCCSMVHPILRMLNTPVDIYDRTYTYLFIIFLGNGATVFYNMISNILRALGDSRTPLYFLIFSSLLNVVLDVVFIVPFDMDVAGAAWATVLAQAISAALCIVFALKRFTILHLSAREWRFSAETAWRHLKVGFPMGFQMSVMCIGQPCKWSCKADGTVAKRNGQHRRTQNSRSQLNHTGCKRCPGIAHALDRGAVNKQRPQKEIKRHNRKQIIFGILHDFRRRVCDKHRDNEALSQ